MFSMRRNFRRPIGLFFFVVFLWIFVFEEVGYNDETNENQDLVQRSDQKSKTSPHDIKRHKNVEDVIFGQGIVMTRLTGRISQDQNELMRRSQSDIRSAKTSGVSLDYNHENHKHAFSIENNAIEKEANGNMKIMTTKKNDQNYPVRYKNIIEESKKEDLETPSVMRNGNSTAKNSFRKAHEQRSFPAWMRITDDIYTYSAFWDDRKQLAEGPVARILGILRLKNELLREENKFLWRGTVKEELLNCTCLLWYRGEGEGQPGILKAHIFDEGRKVFGGTFFFCYPNGANNTRDIDRHSNLADSSKMRLTTRESNPYAVSLYPDNTVDAPHKLIYLRNNPVSNTYNTSKSNSSAVCVRALFGPYNDIGGITQFVSYYTSVFKISHFYFYDLAVAPQIYELLESFRDLGLTFEFFPWNLPTSEWGELWDMGSLVALNDCIYRSSGKHDIVAIVDLDEFIVPKNIVNDLSDLYMKVLYFRKGEHGDAVLLSNVFFCLEFLKESESHVKKNESFPIFRYTHREPRLWPPKSRSKMLVVPESVVSVGHHMVHGYVTKTLTNRSAPKHLAVLHHYRACGDIRLGMFGTGEKVLNEEPVRDLSMMKYKKLIMNSKTMKLFRKKFYLMES